MTPPVSETKMSALLTDELVEKVARAIANVEDGMEDYWEAYEQAARRALTAALPDLIEICAKVAEERFPYQAGLKKTPAIASAAAHQVARAIRSLLTTPEDK